MKNVTTGLFVIFCLVLLGCNTKEIQSHVTPSSPIVYDSVLAKSLGADDYGMRQYVMAFLKSGPNRSQDSTTAVQLQRAHLDNITKLANEGKLVFAGPFMDDFDIKGIYIFAVESLEEAQRLTSTDPAIEAGRLTMELHPFYGSAALMQVNEIHQKISKIDI